MSQLPRKPAPSSLGTEQIAFYDSAPPGIPAGEYELETKQSIEARKPIDPKVLKHYFDVTGPQLGLDPGDLVANFPPNGSQADWSTVIPHAVLARPTLPWEVTTEDEAPWMALLLLSTDAATREVSLPAGEEPGNPTFTQTVPLAEYLTPPDAQTAGPVLDAKYVERLERRNPERSCVVVDVEASAFAAVAPEFDELPYLVHARQAAADAKTARDGEGSWFSVVVGNRLPGRAGGRFAAHLVSLQGYTDYLPGKGGVPGKFSKVRFLSLANWAFQSLPEGPDFRYLMERVEIDTLRMPVPNSGPAQATTSAQEKVSEALTKGYVGLPYGTRSGEPTTAWYRGPCHPVPMKRDPQPLFESADAALVYDEGTGMFDTSFATAWQLGRLLALANRKFTLSFVAWVRDHLDKAYLLAERMALFQEEGGKVDAAELVESGFVRRRSLWLLAHRLAPASERSILTAVARPRDPSGLQDRLHKLPGVLDERELERAVAEGDPHEAIRSRGEES